LDTFITAAIAFAVLAAAAAVYLAIRGVHQTWVSPLVAEAHGQGETGFAGIWALTVRKLGAFNKRMVWLSYQEKIGRQLVRAGAPFGYRPEDILGLQEMAFAVGWVVGIVALHGLDVHVGYSILFAALGGLYPLIWLSDQVKKRHLKISRALPYNLDLLTLSVEAGLDFTGALAKVVEKGKEGPLREELMLVLKQLKMGKTREEALRDMAARVGHPGVSAFSSALIQADRMGTSLGKVLRIQATQLRADRTQRAEKLANEAPVKMLFPLIACIFPTVFLILFGPIVFAILFGNAAG
jgi:tight adherence protein C